MQLFAVYSETLLPVSMSVERDRDEVGSKRALEVYVERLLC